ncbi:hypothetical protein AURDEDRAFT_174309 [Auricularia subglabra TFB-10046 SS5]|nr:hypothetical protein AURDEDRAFT_174309 [Auricularia subglabra TFB-10046 SS5]
MSALETGADSALHAPQASRTGSLMRSDIAFANSPGSPIAAALVCTAVPLPVELLREVFVHALGTDPAAALDDPRAEWSAILASTAHRAVLPFHLAAVSRRWRRVALDTAELWTWLSFGSHLHGTLILDHEYLQTMLLRSTYAPVDVFIDVGAPLRDAWAAAADTVCSAIMGAAARWRFLCVMLPPSSDVASVASLLACRAPVLERLVVGHCDNSPRSRLFNHMREVDPGLGAIGPRFTSSGLRSIEISECFLESVLVEPQTTFPSLVHICLDNVQLRPGALWQMLDSASRLQRLCLAAVGLVDGSTWRPPPAARLRLSNLTELYYAAPEVPAILSQWVQHLDLPLVEYLEVVDVLSADLLALAPCLRDSLRRFSHICNGPEDLVPVFALLPHVREIDLTPYGYVLDPALLRAMAEGVILRELDTLIIYGAQFVWSLLPDESESHATLERAVEARACARAMLDFARTRHSPPESRQPHSVTGRRLPRLKCIQFDESMLEPEFVAELQELAPVLLF